MEDIVKSSLNRGTAAIAGLALLASMAPAGAGQVCTSINAAQLEITIADCAGVYSQLQASGMFPDVFSVPGKTALYLCYVATKPVVAQIGDKTVTIVSSASAWTTDFLPILFQNGTDYLGTVVTQLTIAGLHGNSQQNIYTRDTIDLSQIATGHAPEQDVIVGGTGYFNGATGSYRIDSAPKNGIDVVDLTNLSGTICF